jgi:hypothetical protein
MKEVSLQTVTELKTLASQNKDTSKPILTMRYAGFMCRCHQIAA